jgi:hypothetical protein
MLTPFLLIIDRLEDADSIPPDYGMESASSSLSIIRRNGVSIFKSVYDQEEWSQHLQVCLLSGGMDRLEDADSIPPDYRQT